MQQIHPRDLHALLQNEAELRLIDVREEEEFAYCRLPGAELFPLSRIHEWESSLAESSARLLIYCHHGVRSARVCARLRSLGHEEPINLAGGIERWAVEVDPSTPRY